MRAQELLTQLGIEFRTVSHPAIYTMHEGEVLHFDELLGIPADRLVKNLLLNDTHGRLVLVVAANHTRVNLKSIAKLLGTTRLSFAPPERLQDSLGSEPGSASLFDVVQSSHAREITIVIEENLAHSGDNIGFPNGSNTQTLIFEASQLPRITANLPAQEILYVDMNAD